METWQGVPKETKAKRQESGRATKRKHCRAYHRPPTGETSMRQAGEPSETGQTDGCAETQNRSERIGD
jgi:hypothetical protein